MTHINGVPGIPSAVATYSQAVKVNYGAFSILNVAGMIGINAETGALGETLEDQVHNAMKNLKTILEH